MRLSDASLIPECLHPGHVEDTKALQPCQYAPGPDTKESKTEGGSGSPTAVDKDMETTMSCRAQGSRGLSEEWKRTSKLLCCLRFRGA